MDKLREIKNVLKTVYVAKVEMNAGDMILSGIIIMLLSLVFGLVVLGWLVWPVEWDYSEIQPEIIEVVKEVEVQVPVPVECDDMNCLEYGTKAVYVRLLSEWNAFRPENEYFPLYLSQMDDIDAIACDLANGTDDIGEMRRYIKVAYEKNGKGCQ